MDPNEGAAGVLPSKDAINQAFQQWQAGQQQPAIDLVRPYADRGDLWALALITWFLHQTGDPGWRAAIPYAERAIRAGYPAAVNYVLGNMQGDPALRVQAAELTALAIARGFPMDPMGYAQNAATQGDGESAIKFLAAVGPYPASPDGWDELVAHANQATERIEQSEQVSNAGKQTIQRLESELEDEVRSATSRIKTQTGQLFALIEAATNRQSEAIFDDEAKTLKAEESGLWKAGMTVVGVAAVIAVVPLVLHYLKIGPQFSSANLLTAHFTSAGSFAVVAGVLLARARGRDRARQRARDLTLALSTMFAYAGQIENEEERSKFTYDMGRVIIESFLRADSTQDRDESSGLLAALLRRS